MRVVTRQLRLSSRSDVLTVVPLFDIHLGNRACDEERLQRTINRIQGDPLCYWIGGGDYCEFINRRDKRFDAEQLADWLTVRALGDLAKAQRERLLDYLNPIASKCLALLKGNHETDIKVLYERDIYSDIITEIKEKGHFKPEDNLGIGMYGWLNSQIERCGKNKSDGHGFGVQWNLHHGFTNGRLAGAKALNMQRWLWTHNCDIALQGHSHDCKAQVEKVEGISIGGVPYEKKRWGVYCGSFLSRIDLDAGTTYAEEKGYLPLGQVERWEIRIRPDDLPDRRIDVVGIT